MSEVTETENQEDSVNLLVKMMSTLSGNKGAGLGVFLLLALIAVPSMKTTLWLSDEEKAIRSEVSAIVAALEFPISKEELRAYQIRLRASEINAGESLSVEQRVALKNINFCLELLRRSWGGSDNALLTQSTISAADAKTHFNFDYDEHSRSFGIEVGEFRSFLVKRVENNARVLIRG